MSVTTVLCAALFLFSANVVEARVKRQLSNDLCRSVFNTAQSLNHANQSFIYRCRPGDECGGIGDRLAGVMGGVFYSFLHDRSFRILWPGLDHVFSIGALNWTFDANELHIPYLNSTGGEIDQTRVRDVWGNQIYDDVTGKDVGVVNDLNTRQILNETLIPKIEKYKNVYFHSNRGTNDMLFSAANKHNQWVTVGNNRVNIYAASFLCAFEAMFRPAEVFLKSSYKSLGRERVPFSHILRVVEDEKFTTVAYHHRVDDPIASSNSAEHTIADDVIARIIEIAKKHRVENTQLNLFFITNSIASALKVMRDDTLKAVFHQVYSQELTATIHVNEATMNTHLSAEAAILSTQQAMRDWWIMRMSDVLIGGMSGFLKSAALLAPAEQIRYEEEGRAYRSNYWVMCGGRFC